MVQCNGHITAAVEPNWLQTNSMNAEGHKLIKPNRATTSAKITGLPEGHDRWPSLRPQSTCRDWMSKLQWFPWSNLRVLVQVGPLFQQQDRICSTPLESEIPHWLDLPIQNLEKNLCMENEQCDTCAIGAHSLVNLQIPKWDPSPLSATPELLSPNTKQYWRVASPRKPNNVRSLKHLKVNLTLSWYSAANGTNHFGQLGHNCFLFLCLNQEMTDNTWFKHICKYLFLLRKEKVDLEILNSS